MGQARDVVERWWSLFEAGRLDKAAALAQSDVEVKQPGGTLLRGPAELIPMLQVFRDAFPDIRHQTVDVVESSNKIAVELTVTATHTGTFRTLQGDIPPAGRTIVWESVDVLTLRDGKIASWHTYFDQMVFLAQLGLLPGPVTA